MRLSLLEVFGRRWIRSGFVPIKEYMYNEKKDRHHFFWTIIIKKITLVEGIEKGKGLKKKLTVTPDKWIICNYQCFMVFVIPVQTMVQTCTAECCGIAGHCCLGSWIQLGAWN